MTSYSPVKIFHDDDLWSRFIHPWDLKQALFSGAPLLRAAILERSHKNRVSIEAEVQPRGCRGGR